jgi:hypothetical protein
MRFLYGAARLLLESLWQSMPSSTHRRCVRSKDGRGLLRHVKLIVRNQQSEPDANARWTRRIPMMDVILLALGAALFAVSVGYAYACERL